MSGHLPIGQLEEIADGAPVPVHMARCGECTRRLAFLRAERELVRRAAAHDARPVEPLWPGVQARIAHRRPSRRRIAAVLAAAAAAAAAFVFPRRIPDGVAPGARAAVDRAESEYLDAIDVLESRVALREQALPAAALEARRAARARSRAAIAHARAPEIAGRIRQLEGYAAYLRSLRRELDEAP